MQNLLESGYRRPYRLLLLFVISVAINWPWEMLQMPAYQNMSYQPWIETAWICFRASLGDGLITVVVYGLTLLILRALYGPSFTWIKSLVCLAILGLTVAIVVEKLALSSDRWSYSNAMPIVPIFQVGLLPLLQLPILVPLAVGITHWLATRSSKESGRHRVK